MGIWIRSQGRGVLMEVDYVSVFDGDKVRSNKVRGYKGECEYVLGEYVSDQKRLQILDEIQENIRLGNRTYDMPQE